MYRTFIGCSRIGLLFFGLQDSSVKKIYHAAYITTAPNYNEKYLVIFLWEGNVSFRRT